MHNSKERIKVELIGVILQEEFMEPMNLTNLELGKRSGIYPRDIYRIVRGDADITLGISKKLGKVLGMSGDYLFNLQSDYYSRK